MADHTGLCVKLLVFVFVNQAMCFDFTEEWINKKFDEIARKEATQSAMIHRQESMIKALQQQVQLQDNTISNLQQDLQQRTSEYSHLANQVATLQQTVYHQTSSASANVSVLLGRPTSQQSPLPALSPDTDSSRLLDRQTRLLVESTPDQTVAFHAVASNSQNVDVDDNVAFENVQLNTGDAYHAEHGLFVAPVSGLYIFSTSVTTENENTSSHITAVLMKNGSPIGKIYARGESGHRDQGSITAVTQLQAGDEMWVRITCCAGESYFGNKYSSFTGALLFQN